MERPREDPHATIQRLFDETTLRVIREAGGPISPKELIDKVTPLMDETYQNWRSRQRFVQIDAGPAALTRRAVWVLAVAGAVSFTSEHEVVFEKNPQEE